VERSNRRLAAIVAADVVGYSRMMHADELGTLQALRSCRREVIDPAIVTAGGRIVKTMGDGAMLAFDSAREAVGAARAIQRSVGNQGGANPFRVRIGIHTGDAMHADLLIHSIVQQTMVFTAQLATAGGVRAPLASLANQVFRDLTRELRNQGR